MTQVRIPGGMVVLVLLAILATLGSAAYEPRTVLKFPFLSEHIDSLGNYFTDSLVRNRAFRTTLYRTGMTDSLTVESVTNDSGFTVLLFDRWPHLDQPVDSSNIGRLDISLPNTYRATLVGGSYTFEPLRMESVPCFGHSGETITVVLPLAVSVQEFTIGSGPYHYDFVVLADCHIADGKKEQNNMRDFGTQGWCDEDNDPSESTPEIQNVEALIAYVNRYLVGSNGARFVVLAGDITSSSERSEWQRARKVLAGLDSRVFIVPIMGNHDGWPYVGGQNNYWEQPAGQVKIGEYYRDAFRGVYDTLRCILPAANWQESPWLSAPTSTTGQAYPSYYNNFAFSYQGCRFIATDFSTRRISGTQY